jgi:hypothetical protein
MIWYDMVLQYDISALMINEPYLTMDRNTDHFFNWNYNESLPIEKSQYDVLCGNYSNLSEKGEKRAKTVQKPSTFLIWR